MRLIGHTPKRPETKTVEDFILTNRNSAFGEKANFYIIRQNSEENWGIDNEVGSNNIAAGLPFH